MLFSHLNELEVAHNLATWNVNRSVAPSTGLKKHALRVRDSLRRLTCIADFDSTFLSKIISLYCLVELFFSSWHKVFVRIFSGTKEDVYAVYAVYARAGLFS